jgi:hypothetical protein
MQLLLIEIRQYLNNATLFQKRGIFSYLTIIFFCSIKERRESFPAINALS